MRMPRPPSGSKLNLTHEATLSCKIRRIRGHYRRFALPPHPRHVVSVVLLEIDLNCR
jgi:hypothetical protein